MIPELPYIGSDHSSLTGNLASSVSALTVYRVIRRQGKSIGEIGRLLYQIIEAWIRRYPRLVRLMMGRYFMSRSNQRWSRQKAAISQERRYAGDWVLAHVEGDGVTFDWGMDYTECGIVKFLHS